MNKKVINRILTLVIILVVLSLYFLADYFLFNINAVKPGEYITQTVSPDGRYIIYTYLNNGGATTDYATLCVLEDSQSKEKRNIYWEYHCDTAEIKWIDNDTVNINGVILNDVTKDKYDYRLDSK